MLMLVGKLIYMSEVQVQVQGQPKQPTEDDAYRHLHAHCGLKQS